MKFHDNGWWLFLMMVLFLNGNTHGYDDSPVMTTQPIIESIEIQDLPVYPNFNPSSPIPKISIASGILKFKLTLHPTLQHDVACEGVGHVHYRGSFTSSSSSSSSSPYDLHPASPPLLHVHPVALFTCDPEGCMHPILTQFYEGVIPGLHHVHQLQHLKVQVRCHHLWSEDLLHMQVTVPLHFQTQGSQPLESIRNVNRLKTATGPQGVPRTTLFGREVDCLDISAPLQKCRANPLYVNEGDLKLSSN
ncbi:hypothetical protein HMI56_003299 [Coelomomyces lativittatus]|nr:hypothetical protein HMI56_003299 [Coelomomyces lativittatus]